MTTTLPTACPPYDEGEPPGQPAFERMPPQDVEAEQSVLGGMLLSQHVIGDVVEVVRAEDFYRPAHAAIFDAVLALDGHGEPADPITVAAELAKAGDLARVGGASYLHTLVQVVPTAANAEYYAEIVADRAKLRRLVEAGTRITHLGYAAEGDANDILDAAGAELHAAVQLRRTAATIRVGDRYAGYIDRLEHLEKNGAARGVLTGLDDLDVLTGGLHPGQMIVIAARPSLGKSTLALDLARACAIKQRRTAALFSLEMSEQELLDRITSAEARVSLHHVRSGALTAEDWQRIARIATRVAEAPLYLDVTPNTTVMEIKAKCRRLQQGDGLDLVVIDYLQLLTCGRKVENRQLEVAEMSRSLKLLAKELQVPVVVLSQLNRGPELRSDKKPMLSDLRDSGAVEQDADVVILLHREDAYDKNSPRSGEADLIVAKHRNGATSVITAAALLHYSQFADMAANA